MNNAILGILGTFLAMSIFTTAQKTCTITLKDGQGAYHQMTGKADD